MRSMRNELDDAAKEGKINNKWMIIAFVYRVI